MDDRRPVDPLTIACGCGAPVGGVCHSKYSGRERDPHPDRIRKAEARRDGILAGFFEEHVRRQAAKRSRRRSA